MKTTTPQKRALAHYRSRLKQQGLARFEVLGLETDRELIRSVAKRLANGDQDSARIRTAVSQSIAVDPPQRGGIFNALRRSPLVGAELDLRRPKPAPRKIDL